AVRVTRSEDEILSARAVVLPGVGHFGHCARELRRFGLDATVRTAGERGIPLLGLCVGMQLLFEGSDEDPETPGLGLYRGRVRRLRGPVRVPHTGWNRLRFVRAHPWLAEVPDAAYFYFVHAFAAEPEDQNAVVDVAARVAEALSIPFCVGGGIDSAFDAAAILRAGADKVAMNTAAVRRPELLGEIAARAGAQAAVLAIDARRRDDGSYEVVIEGGRTPTGLDAVEWARRGVEHGAGEILLTSMDRDGTRDGFDLELTALIADAVRVPIIASGGAGEAAHFVDLFARTG